MSKAPNKMLFMTILMLSTIISSTTNSWLGVWLGLEINLLSFIPMMSDIKYNSNISSIKYFIIQTMASISLLTSYIIHMININIYLNLELNLLSIAILMKMGAAPLHFWFPEVMENISWLNCLMLMTWQKLAPMIVLFYLHPNMIIMMTFIIMSAMIGAIMGMNQTSLRMILAYSSINHIGWMITALQVSFSTWLIYISIYSILNMIICSIFEINNVNSIKEIFTKNNNKINSLSVMISVLSLGGMPPLLGFVPKWILMQDLVMKHLYIQLIYLIISTTLTLYFYLKMFSSASLIFIKENKWMINLNNMLKMEKIMIIMNLISSLGLCLSMLIMK
uniref:NADH-ubiquinone oxidoreductase chain 2 n=1 Tax=Zhengitettix curvispinus TaxID=2793214 RepID=A0A7T0II33_9ORTH|nr:NADH dehydrogenase subunit 2 [Zhengitettix curvispinus]